MNNQGYTLPSEQARRIVQKYTQPHGQKPTVPPIDESWYPRMKAIPSTGNTRAGAALRMVHIDPDAKSRD